ASCIRSIPEEAVMGSGLSTSRRHQGLNPGGLRPAKYLTCNLNRLPYACALDRVQEVMGVQSILSLPDAPSFVRGAVCVRQRLILVIDLRLTLALPARVPNRRNCILLLRVGEGPQQTLVGVIVDSVSEIVDVYADEVREAPDAFSGARPGLVSGTVRIRGRLTRVIDVNLLLTSEERNTITTLAA
ncbi:MAG: chemotaxis protein CheW, partial [Acidobacteria bacterium]|nr:chemotaxis protein CheW [Acidobacteriota bacterium]